MPSDTRTVEVVCCGSCASLEVHPNGLCAKCGYCLGSGDRETALAASGSLTDLKLRLAEAVDRADHLARQYATRLLADHPDGEDTATAEQRAERVAMMGEWDAADAERVAALAALRAHKDYTAPTRGEE